MTVPTYTSLAGQVDAVQEIAAATGDLDLLQADRPGYGTRNILEVSFNMVNATVGAGVIGLPMAIYYAGFFNGLILSVIVGILTYLAVHTMILAAKRAGVYKFAALGEHVLGRPGFYLLNLMLFIQSAGSCVSYIISKFV